MNWKLAFVAVAACLLCVTGARAEGPARLVRDFFPDEFEGSLPVSQLTQLGDELFFVADDRDSGQGVWRTDGTSAGTGLVPISGSVAPGSVRILGRAGERVLWLVVPDGNPTVQTLVAVTGQGDGVVLRTAQFRDLPLILGGRSYFQDCAGGECAIWSTDGTPAGTRPVPALAGFRADNQRLLATFSDQWLVFQSDGKLLAWDAARSRVLTLLPGGAWRVVQVYTAGRTLYIVTRNERWRIWASRLDAPRGTQVFSSGYVNVMGRLGDSLYFSTADGQLWSTDGRRGTTRPYSGLRVDPYSLFADELGAIGSKILLPNPGYYTGGLLRVQEQKREVSELLPVCSGKYSCLSTRMSKVTVLGNLGFEEINGQPWISNGTREGTRRHPVLDQADGFTFRVLGGRLLLGGASYEGEQQLWETDGTSAGTRALSDGTNDRPFRVEGAPVPFAGALFVAADRKPVGKQLWRVEDGRAAAVTDLQHLPSGIDPYFVETVGERYVLSGFRSSTKWFAIDGAGPVEEIPVPLEGCSFYEVPCPRERIHVGARLLFSPYPGYELWATDGTTAGTYRVLGELAALGAWRGEALAVDFQGRLWASDGTLSGTRLLTQMEGFLQPVGPPVAAGSLAYLFRRAVEGETVSLELWRTDGTAEGTLRLASLPFPELSNPYPNPVVVGGRLFFLFFRTLWMSDGTAVGTKPLPTQLPIGTFALTAGGGVLYAGSEGFGSEGRQGLWAIDPATLEPTRLASALRVGGGSVGTPLGSLIGNTLLVKLREDQDVERWWVTEGTPSSTHPIPAPLGELTSLNLVAAGGRHWFAACDPDHGCELWSTDRLGEDTRLVQDLWPGPRSGDPVILRATETKLLFVATDPDVGRELWEIDVSAGSD
ncbi:MAG: hypothetical protein ABUT39_30570 [Acidobacteriota bacterium]